MKVGVLGTSCSKFGELWDVSPRMLAKRVVEEALIDAKIEGPEIEAIYVGNMLSGILGGQENLGALFAEELSTPAPAFKIEGACASGGLAVHNAYLAICSGLYEKVLVLGIEKMTDYQSNEVSSALMGAGSEEERTSGLTFPGLYAILAREYMKKYKIPREYLAAVSVKNHFHGSLNHKAHYRKKISLEDVLKSPMVADPLRLFDCSPVSDGAACLILASEQITKKRVKKPVWVAASAAATDSLGISQRKDLTTLSASSQAGEKAYKMANVRPADIDAVEIHDCFSIAELLALEDLGFYKKGLSGKAVLNEELTLGKAEKLVVNTSGGLKACGHPVGATGVKQVVEIADQLRGKCGERQVENAKIGLTHNVGGSGAVAVVHILRN